MSEKRKIKKFIILTGGRTGSTAIVKWLNSSPLIRCHNEVFLAYHNTSIDSFGYYVSNVRKSPTLYKYGFHWRFAGIEKNPISVPYTNAFMNDLFYSSEFTKPWEKLSDKETYIKNENFDTEKLVGYKIGYTQYDALYGARKWIRDNNVYILQLFRKNLLKKHISKMMADKTSVWHSQDKVNNTKLNLDIKHALERIKITEEKDIAVTRELNSYQKKVLPIYYEDFVADKAAFSEKLATFFEEDAAIFNNLVTSLKKLNPNKLPDLLENYEEVYNSFSKTEYRKFLHD
ncbi:MAG: hypothetical protein AAF573_14065 [Bacteroidota bacterium]